MNPDPSCGPLTNTVWTGFPGPVASFSVPDPKEIISKAFRAREPSVQLEAQQFWKKYSVEEAERSDLVDAASIPARMTYSAINSMEKAIAAAKEISAAERKEMILNFVMTIVLVIPGAGAVADAVGFAAIRSFIYLNGDIGNVAVGIYGAVDNPKSAIIGLF